MKIVIVIDSSTINSSGKLRINNISENDDEVLLTIDQPGGQLDIYVLKKQLKEAINKL